MFEVVIDLLLLVVQLFFVRHNLPFAASAKSKMLTHRLYAVGRGFLDGGQVGFGVAFFLFIYLNVNNIARNGIGDKNGQPFVFANGFSFRSRISNL